jgi:hypothetical protein
MTRRIEDIIAELQEACGRPGLTGILRRAAPAMLAVGLGCAYGGPASDSEVPWCADGIDNDSDGAIDCADIDCADTEVCASCVDGVDNDLNGATDCADATCREAEVCGQCDDGVDDDNDGQTDCDDPDCQQSPACLSGAGGAGGSSGGG